MKHFNNAFFACFCALVFASCAGNNGAGFNAPTAFSPGGSPLTKESVIYTFTGSPDGGQPFAGLLAGKNGEFYGTTFIGGNTPSGNYGTVFQVSTSGEEKVLYSFQAGNDGGNPQAGLIADASGDLFGATVYGGGSSACSSTGGCGVVFELTPKRRGYSERVLHAFNGGKDGEFPLGTLLLDKTGALYGTTNFGGTGTICTPPSGDSGCGTVFKLTPAGSGYKEKILYSFTGGNDGAEPKTALIADSRGALYGTAFEGGSSTACTGGCGTVFKLTPSGAHYTASVIHTFHGGTKDGGNSRTGLLLLNGNVIGATTRGGSANGGIVYQLVPSGKTYKEQTILAFTNASTQGAVPNDEHGLYADAHGNLYGTTIAGGAAGSECTSSAPCGTIFKLAPQGKGYTESLLHSFRGGSDGDVPRDSLVADSTGTLYGTTEAAGTGPSGGDGVIFKVAP